MLQVIFGLLLVLAAIVGIAWFFRRFSMGAMLGRIQPARVVSGVMVGPHERVVIVELAEEWLVLGVTSRNVNLLKTMPKPEGSDAGQPAANPPFAQWLATAMDKARKRQGDGDK
ncbi:flagellar biosynthetic protein FliO [Vogesella sp. LIG4]|uniref:flagellar biosynthetic protein FliO n=1 Tax=Vogesella sp. LIG4 TaxID=1192162 RepID=UPI001E6381A8|nr:flagellar biosynthetic protein FliO [Vogesella sp. LIG4]